MQLSQTAEYALRAVVYLAEHGGHASTTHEIAEGCLMPAGYLSKVLQPLSKGGIVTAQRGMGGGYLLARDPFGLTLLEVISAVEPVQRIRACPLHLKEHASGLCALHGALDEAMASVQKTLSGYTVGEMVSRNQGVRPLCEREPDGTWARPANVLTVGGNRVGGAAAGKADFGSGPGSPSETS